MKSPSIWHYNLRDNFFPKYKIGILLTPALSTVYSNLGLLTSVKITKPSPPHPSVYSSPPFIRDLRVVWKCFLLFCRILPNLCTRKETSMLLEYILKHMLLKEKAASMNALQEIYVRGMGDKIYQRKLQKRLEGQFRDQLIFVTAKVNNPKVVINNQVIQ